jgi:hypothetical protein
MDAMTISTLLGPQIDSRSGEMQNVAFVGFFGRF